MSRLYYQRGITLVELMIAQTLGLILLGGTLGAFAHGINRFEQQHAVSLVQESGRIAVSAMAEDIEQAGFAGCGDSSNLISVLRPHASGQSSMLANWAYRPMRIEIIPANSADEIDALLGTGWQQRLYRQDQYQYGDLVLVQSAQALSADVVSHDPENQQITLAGDQRDQFKPGQVVGISDCHQQTILQLDRDQQSDFDSNREQTTLHYGGDNANCRTGGTVSSLVFLGGGTGTPCRSGTDDSFYRYHFTADSQMWRLSSNLYYLSVQSGTTYPALYRTGFAANGSRAYTEIVAEGVENLRALAGIDADGDGVIDHYTSDQPGPEEQAISLRLWLQLTSLDGRGRNIIDSPVRFPDRNGALVNCDPAAIASDRDCPASIDHTAVRRVFHREIMLRNAST